MTTVTEAEFPARASELLRSVETGETVVVERDGKTIARMEPGQASAPINSPDDDDDEPRSDYFSGEIPYKPLTGLRFATAKMKLQPMEIEVNPAWFPKHDEDEDDA